MEALTQPESVYIEARYDGSCGFVYFGNGRAFFTIETTKSALTVSYTVQSGTVTPATAKAVQSTMRGYCTTWAAKTGRGQVVGA